MSGSVVAGGPGVGSSSTSSSEEPSDAEGRGLQSSCEDIPFFEHPPRSRATLTLRRVGPTDKRQQRGFLHYGECGVSARAHSRRTSDACNQVEPPRCSLLMVRPPIERAHVCHQHRVSLPLALADKRGGAATGFEPRGKGSGVPVRLCCRHQVRSDSTPCKLNKPTRRATTVTLSWGTLLTQHHVLCSEKTALDVLRAANWSLEARTHPHVMP